MRICEHCGKPATAIDICKYCGAICQGDYCSPEHRFQYAAQEYQAAYTALMEIERPDNSIDPLARLAEEIETKYPGIASVFEDEPDHLWPVDSAPYTCSHCGDLHYDGFCDAY